MKDPVVRTQTFPMRMSRLVVMVVFAALLSAVPFHAALAQSLENFAVLGGPAVTLTGSTVNGNVGSLGAYTSTGSTVNGLVYQGVLAQLAYNDFLGEYIALANTECNHTISGAAFSGDLASANALTIDGGGNTGPLGPGVYCFDAAATFTDATLTLDAQGDPNAVWIFKIGTPGSAAYLVGTNFSVVMSDGSQPCPNNVYWWVADYATLTDSHFLGTILAGAAITVTGGTFNGNAFAKAAVTLTGTTLGCTPWNPPVTPIPIIQLGSIMVTGGGEIPVPDPNSTGRATFGFNAQPDKKGGAKGNLNYVNHVTGLHVNGTVDNIMVTDINLDNSPKTVQFSGLWDGGSFIVTVQDNGEPGTNDQFGIWVTVAGSLSEVTPMRVISNGNIQFHKGIAIRPTPTPTPPPA